MGLPSADVTLPLFTPSEDPGPNFAALVTHAGLDAPIPDAVLDRVITLRRQHIDEALDTPRPKRARGNA